MTENNQALESLKNKLLEVMNDKGIITFIYFLIFLKSPTPKTVLISNC